MMARFLTILALASQLAAIEYPPAHVFRTDFNSSLQLTPSQIEASQLDKELVENLQNIYNYEASQLAFGGPFEDDFYTLPPLRNTTHLLPGQVLKVQAVADSNEFSIPAGTVLSRILYTTVNFNGTITPASGFVLWPYSPKKIQGRINSKASVVVWAHGTSGFFGSSAPSAHRALWYDEAGPFELAKQGYAVFAPDYAGLGVRYSWDGSEVLHQYFANSATAHDTLFGIRAALKAFPDKLENNFVVIGHSQGGTAAWAAAQVLAAEKEEFKDLLQGYKGAIPVSPGTDVTKTPIAFIYPTIAQWLHTAYPDFKMEDLLTPLGAARIRLAREVNAGVGFIQRLLLSSDDIVRPDYNETWYADLIAEIGNIGIKDFKGPLLVIQGTQDLYVAYEGVTNTVERTWEAFSQHDLEYLVAPEVGHVPALSATQHHWIQWIQDRLDDKPLTKRGGVRTDLTSLWPAEQYKKRINAYLQWAGLAEYEYQVILPV